MLLWSKLKLDSGRAIAPAVLMQAGCSPTEVEMIMLAHITSIGIRVVLALTYATSSIKPLARGIDLVNVVDMSTILPSSDGVDQLQTNAKFTIARSLLTSKIVSTFSDKMLLSVVSKSPLLLPTSRPLK